MSEYQKQKMKDKRLETHDFIIEQQDEKGVRHRFFDFKKFNTFIEEEEDTGKGIVAEPNSQAISSQFNKKGGDNLQSMKPSDYSSGNVTQGFSGVSSQIVPQKRLPSPMPQNSKFYPSPVRT
jgi:hypothetical protein